MVAAVVSGDFFGNPLTRHVPPELVRHIDIFNGPGMDSDPFALARALQEEPPLVYNMYTHNKGQSWMPARASLVREILSNPALFSSAHQTGFSQLIGENWRLGIVEMDAPDHGKFRKVMAPWVSPPAIAALSDKVRQRAVELIDPMVASGGCEFISAFAMRFPISIFMELMGLPRELTSLFLEWANDALHSDDTDVRATAVLSTIAYLRRLIDERRAAPVDDFISRLLNARIDGEPISADDLIGTCFLLFTGGLDTVAASLGFHFRYLAENPDLQERLRRQPQDIPRAIEELLRVFSPTQVQRRATADTVIDGLEIKEGDWFTIVLSVASMDPHEFSDPELIDIDRTANRHFAFGFGPHFCYGSHLARREMIVAYEELLARLPFFRIDEATPISGHGGHVLGMHSLGLRWD